MNIDYDSVILPTENKMQMIDEIQQGLDFTNLYTYVYQGNMPALLVLKALLMKPQLLSELYENSHRYADKHQVGDPDCPNQDGCCDNCYSGDSAFDAELGMVKLATEISELISMQFDKY